MRFKYATILVEAAKRRLVELGDLFEKYVYDSSETNLLHVQERAKEVLDKLRSALDFCATEISLACNSGRRPHAKIYFPIATRGAKQADFRADHVFVCG